MAAAVPRFDWFSLVIMTPCRPTPAAFHLPLTVLPDARTGRDVRQVTDGEFECVAPYMDKHAWSRDDRYLVFTCNRTGTWQPYRLEVETGEVVQLLEVRHGNFRSVCVDPERGEAYCQSGNTFVAVELGTLKPRLAVDFSRFFPDLAQQGKGFAASLSRDGGLVALSYRSADGRGAILTAPTDGSQEFEIVQLPRDEVYPGHELICPGDDRLISFHGYPDRQNRPNGIPELRAAQWRFDLRSRDLRPLVFVPEGFRATHCLWGRSGNRFYFHRKTVPSWMPTALCSVDREGRDLRVYHETSDYRLGHCCPSPDERWLVTDSQDPDENILMLVHLEGGPRHLLCWPNASIGSGRPDRRHPSLPPHTDRHTHPGFSSTGRYVHYTSDVSGRSQVYVVPVADLL
ncbi:MAG: PD40 domain-containing protein [Planctomycetes bacterium]|nr:PD40 domain-containing protein [Planctomycetota bacterium]